MRLKLSIDRRASVPPRSQLIRSPVRCHGIATMKIQYFGHCAFQIILMNGTTILLDPFRNELPAYSWFRHPFPSLAPNIVLITHPHFDHDNVEALANNPTIIRDPLTVEGAQFRITTLLDEHARGHGKKYGSWNIIFVLEAEGIRFCHWGDNRADISPEQISALGRIDGLTVPVDGSKHLLEFEEVDEVIERLKPKVVFPTHYFIEDLNSPGCELEGISTWLAQQPRVKSMVSDSINLTFSTLPEVTEVWVFESISKDGVTGR